MDSNIEVVKARRFLKPYLQQGGIYTGLLDALDLLYQSSYYPVEPTKKYLTLRDAIQEIDQFKHNCIDGEDILCSIVSISSSELMLTIAVLAYETKLISYYDLETVNELCSDSHFWNFDGFWKSLTNLIERTMPTPAIIPQEEPTQSKSETNPLLLQIDQLNKRVEQLEQELKEKTSELKKAQNKIIEQEDKLKGFDSVFNFDKMLEYARLQRNIGKPCDPIFDMLIALSIEVGDTVRAKKATDEKNKKKDEDSKVINNYNQISGSNVFTGVVNAQQGPSDNQKRLRQ